MEVNIYFPKHLGAITIVILIYCLANGLCNSQCRDDADCYDDNNNRDDDGSGGRILSRKRRALIFPEGSSLQLVYDQTIPIVASQLLFTVGATCALAFQLPHEPIYKITQKLRWQLYSVKEDEPEANDTKRIDKLNPYDTANKHNLYYSPYPYTNDRVDNVHSGLNQTNDMWSHGIKTIMSKLGDKTKTMKKKKFKGKKVLGNMFLRKHHRVFPVFGKRSVDDHLYQTDEDRFYMDHHRNSRFSLYEMIEGFLNKRGKNGKACVLRALCETAQRNQAGEKGPFLLEILRAVFSLPHQTEPYRSGNHIMFDEAHAKLTHDCAKLYSDCSDSIWSPDFQF